MEKMASSATLCENSKDGRKRKSWSNEDTTDFKLSMHRTNNNKNTLASNSSSTTNNISFKNSKHRKLMSAVDESSCSEDSGIVHRRRKTTLRALSDYESSDSDVVKAANSLPSLSRVFTRGATGKTTNEDVRLTHIPFEDSSRSDSDDDLFVTLNSRRGSARALSDHETSDSIEQGQVTLLNVSKVSHSLNSSTSSQSPEDLDLSSENDSVYNIIRYKCKRSNNLFSTSDSSDSDIPVIQQRFRKRIRINSSCEESDINVAQSLTRGKLNKNDLPGTIKGVKYLDTRPQTTRQLRPKINHHTRYAETGCESFSVEISGRTMEVESTETESDSSSSDDQLKTRVHSVTNERSTESIQRSGRQSSTRRQIIRRTRQSRRSNNELEAPRVSSLKRESETSSDDNSCFSLMRVVRFDNAAPRPPLQSYDDSSDSDNNVIFQSRRVRRRTLRVHFSDFDSNIEQTLSDAVNNSGARNSDVSPKSIHPPIAKHKNSSDSDEESEKCPICFSCFDSKEVASPVSCSHSFCTNCIQEWAKNNNTCPVDRKLFNKIMVRRNFNGEVIHEIPVESPPIETTFWVSDDEEEESTSSFYSLSSPSQYICSVCFSISNIRDLSFCYSCCKMYHMSCLIPEIYHVPDEWLCPQCEAEMVSEVNYE